MECECECECSLRAREADTDQNAFALIDKGTPVHLRSRERNKGTPVLYTSCSNRMH